MNKPIHQPMTSQEIEREWQRQEKAEQRERMQSGEHDDAAIDQYRLIHRLLKESDIPALPADFAHHVARQQLDVEQQAQFENLTLRVIIAILMVGGLLYVAPALIDGLQKMSAAVTLPWPMLWATTLALAFAGILDQISKRYRIMHR